MQVTRLNNDEEAPFIKVVLTKPELKNLLFHLRNTYLSGSTYKLYNELYDFNQENK